MIRVLGWVLFLGGLGHIATGYVVFREQLSAIFRAGFVNAVLPHFDRRAAFWFILFGVMVSMSGHIVLEAGASGNASVLKVVGWYLLGVSIVGTLAMTRSPSRFLIPISCLLLWSAYSLAP